MTDTESLTKHAPRDANPDSEPAFWLIDREVIQRGQITIEKEPREENDLCIGDYVDITLYHGDETVDIPDVRIGESGRVTIPFRQRDRYSIHEGDRVDIGVFD